MAKEAEHPENFGHPSQDFTNRHENDRLLRKAGYTIVARVRGKPAIWRSNDGRVLTVEQALREVTSP
jgi:hypothetical protein